ncbi:MAG: glycoside hydrolase family 88 protein [SAR202 cluster bacterium]|nr:glycoside hydrolase family 88 protein [SAR202 cluster bacterium]
MGQFEDLDTSLGQLSKDRADIWSVTSCGVTRSERAIPALIDRHAYSPATDRVRVLLVGGLSGRPGDVKVSLKAVQLFADSGGYLSSKIGLTAIPCGNPTGFAMDNGPHNGSGGVPGSGYPPDGGFFNDRENPESRYVWRWICYQAPDVVLEVQQEEYVVWEANAPAKGIGSVLNASQIEPDDSLLSAIAIGQPDGLGPIPGLRLAVPLGELDEQLSRLWESLIQRPPGASQARRVLDKRRSRNQVEIGADLAKTNGRTLEPLVYTQGVAISGRLRFEEIDPGCLGGIEDIDSLVCQIVSDPVQSIGTEPNSADLAGVVWAEELASLKLDGRFNDLLVTTADYVKPRGVGRPPWPFNPQFLVEDFFMSASVLGRAFRVTKSERYIDLLSEFLLGSEIQHESGLFPHSRRGPYHWGRGNGFAALGMAEALTYMPLHYPARDSVLGMCHMQMEALKTLQEPSGMYLQLIDFPGSYQEFTATCMIGYSMARGIRLGWLDASYRSVLDKAWRGISERVDFNGNIVDGCAGSGVMDNIRSYLDRPANSGYDDRSGSMALWFAAEMERLYGGLTE